MIHEEICTYEVCKLAKEKGFPQDVFGTCEMKSSCYLEDGRFHKGGCICPIDEAYTAPTQSLLQRWLREEKGVTICVDIFDDGWFFDISTFYKQDTGIYEVDIPYKSSNVSPVYDTYELALEDALKYALENLV
jgi:hypothetical protein